MDKSKAAADAVKLINQAKEDSNLQPLMIKAVCSFFDFMKGKELSQADRLFLHYLANQAGLPQYYYPMLNIGEYVDEEVTLQTFSNYINESSLIVGEGVMLHRYQNELLERFKRGQRNRIFLSASTSFGKTFLIYEIVRKMNYTNIAFIFPTLSLLSENLFKIHLLPEYKWVKDNYVIHTLSDKEEINGRNLFIFTPERFLSFLDKNKEIYLDFVFVDEIYKLDNGFIIDEVPQENERDVAYRIALHELLKNPNVDSLLAGPYIALPTEDNQFSFKTFLDYYDFVVVNYNHYEIVNKMEVFAKTALDIEIDNTFHLTFTNKTKRDRVVQLVTQLLNRGENAIIYCSTKASTEKYAKFLIGENDYIKDIDSEKVFRLTNHIDSLFANGKGAQWIVSKELVYTTVQFQSIYSRKLFRCLIRIF